MDSRRASEQNVSFFDDPHPERLFPRDRRDVTPRQSFVGVGIFSYSCCGKRRLTGLIDLSFPEFSGHFDNIDGKAAYAVLKAGPNAAPIVGLLPRRLQGLLTSLPVL
jgi:hypothetical protein